MFSQWRQVVREHIENIRCCCDSRKRQKEEKMESSLPPSPPRLISTACDNKAVDGIASHHRSHSWSPLEDTSRDPSHPYSYGDATLRRTTKRCNLYPIGAMKKNDACQVDKKFFFGVCVCVYLCQNSHRDHKPRLALVDPLATRRLPHHKITKKRSQVLDLSENNLPSDQIAPRGV